MIINLGRMLISRISPFVFPLTLLFLAACSDISSGDGSLDSDGDGIANSSDNCPNVANSEQENSDDDKLGDMCDPDDDNDGAYDDQDDFPGNGEEYLDLDGDGLGHNQDTDNDQDGIEDDVDNCPYVANVDQADTNGIDDGTGLGDACELSTLTDTAQGLSGRLIRNDLGAIGNYDHCNTSQDDGDLQDCAFGRDALHREGLLPAKTGGGIESFDYSKVDGDGNLLAADSDTWNCVLDHRTGLLWERKRSGDTVINRQTDSYFWYMPDIPNAGVVGIQDDSNQRAGVIGGLCVGFDAENSETWCNTHAFIKRMNDAEYCGFSDWRLPTMAELTSIINYGPPRTAEGEILIDNTPKAKDVSYFLRTQGKQYWTSTNNARLSDEAWTVWANYGHSISNKKTNALSVRLVRKW